MSSRVKPIGASLKTKVTVVVSPVVNAVSPTVMVFNTGAIALTVSVLTLAATTVDGSDTKIYTATLTPGVKIKDATNVKGTSN
jgi:hypothetical protein